MESLVAFVIIIAINIITKSVQDKKKIEKARVERTKQLRNKPMSNRVDQAQGKPMKERVFRNENTREILIKKNREPEYENRNKERVYLNSKKSHTGESYADRVERDNEERLIKDNQRLEELQSDKQEFIKEGFDRKLVNAIIWAEILKEPKSIQNIKKGM